MLILRLFSLHRYSSKSQRAIKQRLAPVPQKTSARSFYNRAQEVEQLSTRLKKKPQFTVLLGPPSSGKTALARHVTSQKRLDGSPEFHPLTINLRAVDTFEKSSFLNAFVDEGICAGARDVFWKRLFSGFEVSAGGFTLKSHEIKTSTATAANVFKELGNRIKPYSYSQLLTHGERPPVLIIDEANSFKRMGDESITAFLDFAVRVTKEEEKMHVIFTSSDSFFESWLKQRVNATHFNTLVVGDLPREEANKYFLHLVSNDEDLSNEKKNLLTSMDFDIVFKMTGGRMFFINSFIQQVHESGFFDDPMRFQPVQLAYAIMEDDFLGKAKTYSEQEALMVCKHLVLSPGYVSYFDLLKKLGRPVLEEMFERNFVHYRPVSQFARDLIPFPSEPVVTAQSEPALRAMEAFVKKLGKQ